MVRTSTTGAAGSLFHVYNRGVDKRIIFNTKTDYLRFYQSLFLFNTVEPAINFSLARSCITKNLKRDPLVKIHAYALLPNHFHLLLEAATNNGIGEFMRRISTGYTSYFNEANDRSGVLFQGIYKRVLVETDEYYNYLFAYINENHTVHGVKLPEDILYSSSWHFQKVTQSNVIAPSFDTPNYNHKGALALAHEIYQRRNELKRLLIE